jgi:hypothetical protein
LPKKKNQKKNWQGKRKLEPLAAMTRQELPEAMPKKSWIIGNPVNHLTHFGSHHKLPAKQPPNNIQPSHLIPLNKIFFVELNVFLEGACH